MKPSQKTELISYFAETLKAIKGIKVLVDSRNKTAKIKAVKSMLSIVEARLTHAHNYVQAGGETEFDVFFHKELYDPIIVWLGEELLK